MTASVQRRELIRRLIAKGGIHVQGQLVEALREEGYEVTQATVSRDLAALGVVRGVRGGQLTYLLPDDLADNPSAARARLQRLLADLPLSIAETAPFLVLRTSPGAANAIASAIDLSGWDDVVGTIAGDDTIFVACPDGTALGRVRARLEAMSGAAQPDRSAAGVGGGR